MPDHPFPQPSAAPLTQLIRHQVVPALVGLYAPAVPLPEASELARELAHGGHGEALLRRLIANGVGFETLMLRVITPAAQELGQMWADDTCSFATVTLGTWRLRMLAQRVSELLPMLLAQPDPQRSILVSALPGEQHDFGVAIVAEFLARDGWLVTRAVPRDIEDLRGELRVRRPTLVGLSIARPDAAPLLAETIAQIRRLNPSPRILVGGPAIAADPQLARRAGADAAATCARSALDIAQGLLPARTATSPRKDHRVGSTTPGSGVPGIGPRGDSAPRLSRG